MIFVFVLLPLLLDFSFCVSLSAYSGRHDRLQGLQRVETLTTAPLLEVSLINLSLDLCDFVYFVFLLFVVVSFNRLRFNALVKPILENVPDF